MAIYTAIKKHGWDSFGVEILERCPRSDLPQREMVYIAMFDTFKGFGYNSTPGGNGGSHSEETKAKLSKSLKGRKCPTRRKDVWDQQDKVIEDYLKTKNCLLYTSPSPRD